MIALSVAMLTTGLLGLRAGSAQARWLAARRLSPAGGLAVYPEPALDRHGRGVVVWMQNLGSSAEHAVMSAQQRRVGGGWSSPRALSSSGVDADFPQVAIDAAGAAVVAWVSGIFTQTPAAPPPVIDAVARHSWAAGWSHPAQISPHLVQATEAQLAMDARGDAYAIWVADKSGTTQIETATRTTGGRWSRPSRLDSGRGLSLPRIAVDAGGDAVAVWMRSDGGTPGFGERFNRVVAAVKPFGTPWRRPTLVGNEAEFVWEESFSFEFPGPRVVMNASGDAAVVWQARRGSIVVPELSVRLAGAGSWQKPSVIETREAFDPAVALDAADDATVVWAGPGNSVITARRTLVVGCSWTKPQTLYPGNPTIFFPYPQVATNASGETIATWAGRNVQAAVLRDPHASWQRPVSLGVGGVSQVTLDANGTGLIVWQRGGSDSVITIQAAEYMRRSRQLQPAPGRCA